MKPQPNDRRERFREDVEPPKPQPKKAAKKSSPKK